MRRSIKQRHSAAGLVSFDFTDARQASCRPQQAPLNSFYVLLNQRKILVRPVGVEISVQCALEIFSADLLYERAVAVLMQNDALWIEPLRFDLVYVFQSRQAD